MRHRPHVQSVDVLLVLLTVLQLVELWLTRPDAHTVSGVLLTAMSTTTLLARRRAPLAAALLCLAAHGALIQLVPDGLSATFFALLVALVVIGGLPRTSAAAGLVAAAGIAAEGAFLDVYGGGVADFAMSVAILGAAWLLGALVAHRGQAAREAAARADAADQARARAAEQAVALERARMTSELHDVVAHGLTVLVVQTEAAQNDLDHGAPVESLRRRLQASGQVARQSLAELRTLLGILQEPSTTPSALASSSGELFGIDALVHQLRDGGAPIELTVDGEPAQLGPGLELALYRVAQESLTNALKHGDGTSVSVTLRFGADQVALRVVNGDRARGTPVLPGSGRGLAGLRERVLLHGGEFCAEARGPHFVVSCTLPRRDREPDRPAASASGVSP